MTVFSVFSVRHVTVYACYFANLLSFPLVVGPGLVPVQTPGPDGALFPALAPVQSATRGKGKMLQIAYFKTD